MTESFLVQKWHNRAWGPQFRGWNTVESFVDRGEAQAFMKRRQAPTEEWRIETMRVRKAVR